MTREQALRRIGEAIADALRSRFEGVAPDGFALADVVAVPEGEDPLAGVDGVDPPVLLASARSTEEAVGGSLLVLALDGARALAGALAGEPTPAEVGDGLPPRSLELLAPCLEAAMQEAAAGMGELLGEAVGTSAPTLRVATAFDDALPELGRAGQACRVDFLVLGAPATFVQVLPHAAIVRMTGARDELAELGGAGVPLGQVLRRVDVRVWAELGRARMASGRASVLPAGAIVELDRGVDDPVDLYADGMRFARGRLVVDDDGALGVRIESLGAEPEPA